MTRILDRLPPLPQSTTISFGERHVQIHRGSLLVWVSIGLSGEDNPERLSPPFPALLDSGNNYDFYLHEHHLIDWAGVRPTLLAVLSRKRINRQEVACHEADVWIYPNQPGTHRRHPGRPPFHLDVPEGIAVAPQVPEEPVDPRLPLLGFSALGNNSLDFWFDSKSAQCHLWTAGWRSKIMRLLSRF